MVKQSPVVVVLGGFLGAGKTSLILAAAKILHGRGVPTAAILNDQGADLVDTEWVAAQGVSAGQVTGGCFCCLFSDLIEAAEQLRAHSAKVIFAEAVGSCVDLSATVLQPLKLYYGDRFALAPYTVLVDPGCARNLMDARNSEFMFLFQKQVDEADLICFTKSDLYATFPHLGCNGVRYLSSVAGEGVEAWLDEVLCGSAIAGNKLLDVDYDRYALAEASLAWLNCKFSVTVRPGKAMSPAALLGPFLESLEAELTSHKLEIAHLKLTDFSNTGMLKASIVRNGEPARVEGDLSASPAMLHEFLLNLRAAGEPNILESVVRTNVGELPGELEIRSFQCFRPSRPKPEHRLRKVVGR